MVMLKPGVLDPQGKAISHALHTLGFGNVGEVRAGKVIELELAETDPGRARAAAVEEAGSKSLLPPPWGGGCGGRGPRPCSSTPSHQPLPARGRGASSLSLLPL